MPDSSFVAAAKKQDYFDIYDMEERKFVAQPEVGGIQNGGLLVDALAYMVTIGENRRGV